MPNCLKSAVVCSLFLFGLAAQPAAAQLDQTFNDIFGYFLSAETGRISLSGQFHGDHYRPAADQAESLLTPALNALIASNIASFPLSSTIAGYSIDVSTGRPVLATESLGPIFAETAESIGPGKIIVGLSYSFLSLNQFRGLGVDDMRFTFIHQDVDPAGPGNLGAPAYELDNIDVFPNLDISSNIFAFIVTAGITRNMDISLGVPIINVRLSGDARAVINSYTYGRLNPARPEFQGAAHRFGGDLLNPILEADTTYDVSTNGIGDIAVRLKYVFLNGTALSMAALADVRIPTGDEHNFLSTGKLNARYLWIISGKYGDFNPHINIGYDQRGGALDSDEFEYAFGFDHKLSNKFTFAVDVLGTYDLNEDETIRLFPGAISVNESFEGGSTTRVLDLSNIPETSRDNTLDLAVGLRVAPSDKIVLMGNILTPLNNAGLRSTITPTFGLSISI